jgi:PAP2 superfamily protein
MKLNRASQTILSLLLIGATAYLATSRSFYDSAILSAFFALALASVIIIHFRVRPSWQDALLVLALSALIAVVDFRLLHFKPWIMDWFAFPGLFSLLVLGLRTVWAEDSQRKRLLLAFIPALLFVTSEYFAATFLEWTAAAHPKVLDLYLFSFDSSLHVQFSFLLGQAFSMWPTLRIISVIFYIGLPVPIALVYAGRLLRLNEKAIPSFVAFLATGPIGVIFYNIFPALGPVHIFQQAFPWHPLTVEQATKLFLEPIAITGAPNAIPSLHMAWVLLVWWYSRGLSVLERSIAMAFVFFTVLATLGTGEHYFIDLVVGFPFALLIESVCAFSVGLTEKPRLSGIIFGAFGTLGWLMLLHYGNHLFWISPIVPWFLCAATVAVSIWIERMLYKDSSAIITENGTVRTTLSSAT